MRILTNNTSEKKLISALKQGSEKALDSVYALYDDFDGNKPFVLREKVCEQ